MSALTSLVDLLALPVPAWIALVAIGCVLAVQQVAVARRIDSHARILGHLDRWANSVESRFDALGQGMDHQPPVARARRRAGEERRMDVRGLSSDQFRALLIRLVGTRSA